MSDELLDLVDKNDKVIGEVWMSKAHKDPTLIHREVGIAVFNKKGEVLLQQRSMIKKKGPGAWKVTAAGHVARGEKSKDAIARELYEELGFHVNPKFFKKIFVKRSDIDSTFTRLYYAIMRDKPKLNLNEDEVMDAKWVKIDDLEAFSKKNDYSLEGISHTMIMELKKNLNLSR